MKARQQRLLGRMAMAFAILLAAAVALEETKQDPEETEAWTSALGPFEVGDIVGIEISGKQGAVMIQQESEGWMIQGTPSVLGDARKISNILDTLQGMEAGDPLEATPTSDFGFAPPRSQVVLKLENGTQMKVAIGDDSRVARQTYILIDDQLRTTRFPLELHLAGTLDELRAREVIQFSRSAVREIQLRGSEVALQARLEEGDWWITSSDGTRRGNPETMDRLLSALLDLRVDQFGVPIPTAVPDLELTVTTPTEQQTVQAWHGEGDAWTALGGSHQESLAITPGLAEFATLTETAFLLNKLLPIRQATLTGIEISLGEVNMSAALEGETWSDPRVEGVLATLDTIEVDRSRGVQVSSEPIGVIVLKEDEQRTLRLDLFQESTGHLAREQEGGIAFYLPEPYIQELVNILTLD